MSVYRIAGSVRSRVHFSGVTHIAQVFFMNGDHPAGTDPVSLTMWWRLPGRTDPASYRFDRRPGSP